MARFTQVVDAPIKDLWGEQLPTPGNAGARTSYNMRHGFSELLFEPQTDAARLHIVPSIKEIWFYDASNPLLARWVNLRAPWGNDVLGIDLPGLTHGVRGTDDTHPAAGGTGTVMDSMTASDFLYIKTEERVGGYYFDVGNANGNAATLTAEVSGPAAFTAAAITDNTTTGFGADGNIVFNPLPTLRAWLSKTLEEMGFDPNTLPQALRKNKGYWTRFITDTTFDTATSLLQVSALHRVSALGAASTSGAGLFKASTEYTIDVDENHRAFEVSSQTATGRTLNITNIAR